MSMYIRSVFAACAAVVLSAALVDSAEAAYVIKPRTVAGTVTGLLNPLDLTVVSLVDGGGFSYYEDSGNGYGSLSITFTANYQGTGYTGAAPTGFAGTWQMNFFETYEPLGSGNTFTMRLPDWSGSAPNQIGTLQYLGGGGFSNLPGSGEDTPLFNDVFKLYVNASGLDSAADREYLKVTCTETMATCGSFEIELLQNLLHIGPYACDSSDPFCSSNPLDPGRNLDPLRLNAACRDSQQNVIPCGSVPYTGDGAFRVAGSNVPEPASLALVGIGLVGVALARRRRRAA